MSSSMRPANTVDPYTATREQFTRDLIDREVPANASNDWKKYATRLRELVDHLAHHDAMRSNLQQTYMTPANSKNAIYFMWDFVGRTLGFLNMIPPELSISEMNAMQKEIYQDIQSRSQLTVDLIMDRSPGKLNSQVAMTYPGRPEAQSIPDFGPAVMEDVRKLDEVFPGDLQASYRGITS